VTWRCPTASITSNSRSSSLETHTTRPPTSAGKVKTERPVSASCTLTVVEVWADSFQVALRACRLGLKHRPPKFFLIGVEDERGSGTRSTLRQGPGLQNDVVAGSGQCHQLVRSPTPISFAHVRASAQLSHQRGPARGPLAR